MWRKNNVVNKPRQDICGINKTGGSDKRDRSTQIKGYHWDVAHLTFQNSQKILFDIQS